MHAGFAVGGRPGTPLGSMFLSVAPGEKTIGPRGDPVAGGRDRDEFQQSGHEGQQVGAPDGRLLWVDPLQRVLAHSAPPPESAVPHVTHPALAMGELWRGVRRIAWGGDRQRSVAYIELGAGELNGACLTLEARGGSVSLVVDLPPGASGAGWAERLADRLARRGLEVQSVEVR
ncbi:MAG TPA: hypothetical protein VI197_08460 [Polyangiaceae bacterium]